MSAQSFLVNRFVPSPLPGGGGAQYRAAGTQFASGYPASGSTGRTGRNQMAIKLAVLIALVLAAIPAVATLAWPARTPAGEVSRSVELSGPILGFTQSRERIQVRLVPLAENERRSQVVVRNAAGAASQAIPLKRGQTWASAQLSAELADASSLQISVE
jgi:hypothetical protein